MKKNNNVQMWVALDNTGQQIFIEDAKVGQDYICPECGGIVRARAKDSDYITEHFYHLNKSNCSGESLLHIYWKNNLVKIGETINLPTIGEITCIDKRVEFAFNTSEGKYQPDLVIKTNNDKYKFIILEIHNTNPKIVSEYYRKWEELKYTIFEIDVKGLNKDKSNLNDKLKLLYSFHKEIFIKKTKRIIRDLYDLLKSNPIIKETTEKFIPEDMQELIDLGILDEEDIKTYFHEIQRKYDEYGIRFVLSKFYKLFKNNLNACSNNKLNEINEVLKTNQWDKNTYDDFIIPLLDIHKQLQIYT